MTGPLDIAPTASGLYTVHHTLAVNAKRYANRLALAQDACG